MKNLASFLFEKITIPDINTFIILDIIIKIIKSRKNKKEKIKKVLYLTNKTLTDIFPPDFNFILNFLNSSLEYNRKWNIQKIKGYKNLNNEENKNYFNFKSNSKIDIEELKSILRNIHIKYIHEETHLMKLLYKLNEHKKYNLIIINLAFFFVKDKKKIQILLENISSEYKIKKNTNISLNNTNDYIIMNKNHSDTQIENEICDNIFFKNVLNIHFHYSFFINFFEYLNNLDDFSFIFNSIEKKEKKEKSNNTSQKKLLEEDIIHYEEELKNKRKTKRRKINYSKKISETTQNKNILDEETFDKKIKFKNMDKNEYNDSIYNINYYHKNYINSLNSKYHPSIKDNGNISNYNCENSLKHNFDNYLKFNSDISLQDGSNNSLKNNSNNSLKQKKKLKNNLYIYDIIPNSEVYKKMYFNILSMNFNYTYLISCNFS
ncbi:conserved Plasmodium protein, unknown function [Plasmodium gallinaceum]|uniref:Uncharacterized protein n=1 Tax=Plasmodium gallinaceum TaxID=5849 RepID=A0A1J1GZC0_PLAGA|nr:conserved Plasmodium protein, unknown function [Plasmodium gallinaceum]CRG96363.1 conserved Plasmodium protein, unknown function [Plasmodium gallinaceum]